jgi:hypothetical protein
MLQEKRECMLARRLRRLCCPRVLLHCVTHTPVLPKPKPNKHPPGKQRSAVQMSKEELVQSLRRQSKGYHQNSSKFRGVTKHQKGKWEARIGQVCTSFFPHVVHVLLSADIWCVVHRLLAQPNRSP